MKTKFSFPLLLLLLTGAMFSLDSCFDPCKGVSCLNGTCEDGVCGCDEGYEGSECDKAYNSKIYGNYTYYEFCFPSGEYVDTDSLLAITPVPNTLDKFRMNRIWGTNTELICTFAEGGRYFTFPDSIIDQEDEQTTYLEARQVVLYSGEVSPDGSRIDLVYRVRVDSVSAWMDSCAAIITRY